MLRAAISNEVKYGCFIYTGCDKQIIAGVLLRSDVISDINWSSPQIVYDIFIRSEIRRYLQLLQDEINWI